MKVVHPLEPVFNKDSKVLILGSLPSVKSREIGFYYMHPQNRFWKILSIIYNEEIGNSINDKKDFLYHNYIALFDVVHSCEIEGSSDNSIKNVIPNNIKKLIDNSKIEVIFTTGRKAFYLYNKYCYKDTKIEAIYLPSPSAANCGMKMEELINEYNKIKKYTDK